MGLNVISVYFQLNYRDWKPSAAGHLMTREERELYIRHLSCTDSDYYRKYDNAVSGYDIIMLYAVHKCRGPFYLMRYLIWRRLRAIFNSK